MSSLSRAEFDILRRLRNPRTQDRMRSRNVPVLKSLQCRGLVWQNSPEYNLPQCGWRMTETGKIEYDKAVIDRLHRKGKIYLLFRR